MPRHGMPCHAEGCLRNFGSDVTFGKLPAPVVVPAAVQVPPPTITTTEPEPSTVVSEIITTNPAPVVFVRPAVPAIVEPVQVFSEYESVQNVQPLRGVGRVGDFVHNSQVMDERFRNVSTGWTKRAADPDDLSVMSWDSAFEHLERERGNTIDLRSTFGKLDIVNVRNKKKWGCSQSLRETLTWSRGVKIRVGVNFFLL